MQTVVIPESQFIDNLLSSLYCDLFFKTSTVSWNQKKNVMFQNTGSITIFSGTS